jgi:hypothetical protein
VGKGIEFGGTREMGKRKSGGKWVGKKRIEGLEKEGRLGGRREECVVINRGDWLKKWGEGLGVSDWVGGRLGRWGGERDGDCVRVRGGGWGGVRFGAEWLSEMYDFLAKGSKNKVENKNWNRLQAIREIKELKDWEKKNMPWTRFQSLILEKFLLRLIESEDPNLTAIAKTHLWLWSKEWTMQEALEQTEP